MREKILNLLSLCMQAKEKGHDVFFAYSPHVNWVEIRIYKNGYKQPSDISAFMVALDGDENEKHGFYSADTVERALKELI
jgi:hypothetical protein